MWMEGPPRGMKEQSRKDPQSIWNLPELLARVDNDQELLRDLLAIFHEDCPGHISSLEKGIASGDLKSTAAEAHALKGMFANLAAARAAAAAGRLEGLAHDGEKGSLSEGFATLQRELNSLSQALAVYSAAVRT